MMKGLREVNPKGRGACKSGLHNLLGIPGPNSTKGEVKGKNKSGI